MTTPDPALEQLRTQVNMLHLPRQKALLKKLTLLTVRCRRCGDRPFVVLKTHPIWVVCMYGRDPDAQPLRPALPEQVRAEGMEAMRAWFREHRQFSRMPSRREVRSWLPLSHSDGGDTDAEELLTSSCRCRAHSISGAWLRERIEEASQGVTRVVTV